MKTIEEANQELQDEISAPQRLRRRREAVELEEELERGVRPQLSSDDLRRRAQQRAAERDASTE